MKSIVALAMVMAVSAAFAEKQPFERYQSIIDRQMFGPLPEGFDPTKSPNEVQKSSSKDEKRLTQEQEKLQSSIHFSVINVTPDGATAVGFTDNSDPKVPKHYFLKVGETRDGWMVKEADAEEATMTIAKDDVEVSLTLGGNSAKGAGTTTKASTTAKAGATSMRSTVGAAGGSMETIRARRQARLRQTQEARAKAAEEAAAREAERLQQEAERQQQEAERQAQQEAATAEMRRQIQELSDTIKKNRQEKMTSGAEESGDAGNEDR